MKMFATIPKSVATLAAKARTAAARAESYLYGRQSPDGGFCFYRWYGIDEPSLDDTWHAFATLRLLGAEIPQREQVEAFLRGFDAAGFDDFYRRTLALAALDVAVQADARTLERIRAFDAAAALADEHVPVTARLERALRIVTLQWRFAAIHAPDTVVACVRALQRSDGWGDKPNLGDTWLALAILGACGERAFADATRRFVDGVQIASFGFTATTDSCHATLDIVHAGLRACALLELPVRHVADAVGFVLACQSGNGGFARTADALPGIDLTHRAVLALIAAGALPARDVAGTRADSGM